MVQWPVLNFNIYIGFYADLTKLFHSSLFQGANLRKARAPAIGFMQTCSEQFLEGLEVESANMPETKLLEEC
jgi:hypothetical protein